MNRPRALVFGCIFLVFGTSLSRADERDPIAVAFGREAALWNVRLSPDGMKLSALQMHESDRPVAVVYDLGAGTKTLIVSSPEDYDVRWCSWANDSRLLCGFRGIYRDAHTLVPRTRLIAVDADGSKLKVLLKKELREERPQYQGTVVDWLVDDRKHVLIKSRGRGGTGVDRLDIYSGKTRKKERLSSGVWRWISDGHGAPRLRRWTSTLGKREWYFRHAGDSEWKFLHAGSTGDGEYEPAGFGENRNQLLIYKNHEGRLALWANQLDQDGPDTLVYAHPEVDVRGLFRLGKYRRTVAVSYETDRRHLKYFDSRVEEIVDTISDSFPDQLITIGGESWDRRYYLVHISSDQNAGTVYRYDFEKNELRGIANRYPALDGYTLAAMTALHFKARDGQTISGYLTRSAGRDGTPQPTVVFPHGGPESRDSWGFDWLPQFLAAKGYTVLQVNYRGSGGFGDDWTGDGGFKSWRLAIDDITDGLKTLVDKGVTDPKRVCIVGWSYGGYAALMSAIEEPERYRCAVSIAGVTDPARLLQDAFKYTWRSSTWDFVGTDDEVLKAGSPLERASEIWVPVLLFHGDEDVNVYAEHSQKLAKAMKRANKKVEYIEYEDVEHSIGRDAYRIDMLDRIGSLLERHIGGPPKKPTEMASDAVSSSSTN